VTLLPRKFILLNSVEFRGIPHDSVEFRAISCTEFRLRNFSNKFIQETIDFFELETEVEFKNINFAFFYLNAPFGNNLCLEKWEQFLLTLKNLTFSYVFF
jgi:hypothetical protein